ncbi:hypothetical protein [Xylanibacter muris]|uniref:hypothetical protein n=1 Tax=Xylanibacter muris TaxID=2736290 RepID=UPI0025A2B977|nr:hypothetical protein [Xylanibacter muris]
MVRRLDFDGNPFHYIGGRKLLNEGVVSDDVLDWSTNLLGGEFKIEDILWKQKGDGIIEWNEEDVDICDYDECYEQMAQANSVFITVNCLHKTIVPYRRKFGSKGDLEQYAEKTHDIDKEIIEQYHAGYEPECHATVTVEHKPTKLNYWHMTIEITPRDLTEPMPRDGKKNKSVKKRVKEALHLHIIKNLICEEPRNVEDIPKVLYLKQE